jgi:hypothetical protein
MLYLLPDAAVDAVVDFVMLCYDTLCALYMYAFYPPPPYLMLLAAACCCLVLLGADLSLNIDDVT